MRLAQDDGRTTDVFSSVIFRYLKRSTRPAFTITSSSGGKETWVTHQDGRQ